MERTEQAVRKDPPPGHEEAVFPRVVVGTPVAAVEDLLPIVYGRTTIGEYPVLSHYETEEKPSERHFLDEYGIVPVVSVYRMIKARWA